MAFLVILLLALAPAPQTDDTTCPATRFTLNKPAVPKTQPPKMVPEKRTVAQAAPAAPRPTPPPRPGDCPNEKKKG